MSAPLSPIYGIQLLASAQSQPEVPLNLETRILEAMSSLSVVSKTTTAPPGVLVDGSCYIVPGGSSGAWAGMDDLVVLAANGSWVFIHAKPGQQAYVQDTDAYWKWMGTGSPQAWVAV